MPYEAKDYSSLLGTPGFSDNLLNNHFKLYQGYVKNTNNALELMKKHGPGSYEYGEIKRRFGWEFNGMRLHELYFGNMVNGGKDISDELKSKLDKAFGSFDHWKEDFIKTGSMRGIGWVVLVYDQPADSFYNTWINEHDLGYLAGTTPLLVMDVFEHAFMLDYGLDKGSYIKSFFDAVNWDEVGKRLG